HAHALRDGEGLQDRKISLTDVGTTANRTRRISDSAQGVVLAERAWIEVVEIILLRPHGAERRNQVWLPRQLEVEAVHQFLIIECANTNWESSLECSNAGNSPLVQQRPNCTSKFVEWKLVIVAKHKSVPSIKSRKRTTAARVDRVQNAFKARCLIDGLAERIGRSELEPIPESLIEGCLEGVVGRVRNRILREDAAENRNSIHGAAVAG